MPHLAIGQHHGHHGHASCPCCTTEALIPASAVVIIPTVAHVCVLAIALIVTPIATATPLIIAPIASLLCRGT